MASAGVECRLWSSAAAPASLIPGLTIIVGGGNAIRLLRAAFPPPTIIVSPGIRLAGAAADDHKRHSTPAEAITLGADYLVVGRPIRNAPNPQEAAHRIMAEI